MLVALELAGREWAVCRAEVIFWMKGVHKERLLVHEEKQTLAQNASLDVKDKKDGLQAAQSMHSSRGNSFDSILASV